MSQSYLNGWKIREQNKYLMQIFLGLNGDDSSIKMVQN